MGQGLRCIFLVPESDRLEQVERLRERLDPLHGKVPPHVTLAFPFELEGELAPLIARLRSLAHRLPIPFSLGKPDSRDGALFFPLVLGRTDVTLLHDKIRAWLPAEPGARRAYRPHLTFGRMPPGPISPKVFLEAERVLPCSGVLHGLVLERIGEADQSIPEFQLPEPPAA
jgi:2'-5' RNA ligase